jgi:GNAT superfamily N-acetyltransferase
LVVGYPQFSTDVSTFFREAESSLGELEAENNLLLALLQGMVDNPSTIPDPLLLISAEGRDGKAFAIQTPPRAMILSTGWSETALTETVRALKDQSFHLPGVVGPAAEATYFASQWKDDAHLVMDQSIYRLEKLEPRSPIGGEFVRASGDDWSVVKRFGKGFFREAMPNEKIPVDEFLRWVERRLHEGAYHFWMEDRQIVAWAGTSGQTRHGARIGPVYTPAAFRRQGYASALTWHVSEQVLNSGKKYCFLYTDLLNTTSNSIYQKIGYRPILRSQHWHF